MQGHYQYACRRPLLCQEARLLRGLMLQGSRMARLKVAPIRLYQWCVFLIFIYGFISISLFKEEFCMCCTCQILNMK